MFKISVIIPVYNIERYIERCARSLFEQTLDDIEYIFVDDCSTDNSIALLEQVRDCYTERKSSIRIFKNKQNVGSAITRRKGIIAASGKYIICCDSDDYVEHEWCEKLFNKAEVEGLDICICDYLIERGDRREDVFQSFYENEDYITSLIRCGITGSMCNKIVRRELYQAEDIIWPELSFGEDFPTVLQVSLKARNVGYVPEPLYRYVKHPDSLTTNNKIDKTHKENLINNDIAERVLKSKGLFDKYKDAVTAHRLATKNRIRPYIKNKDILKIWRNTYKGLLWDLVQSKYVSTRFVIVYIVTYLGLYPVFQKD